MTARTKRSRSLARSDSRLPTGYLSWLDDLKARIRAAQVKASLAVNAELVLLYWSIGRDILARQEKQGWGAHVVDKLSADLHAAFPEMKGFSPRNLKYMRAFAEAWPDRRSVQQVAARMPWFHSCLLLDRVKDATQREWYARQAIEHGWSRAILSAQIDTKLHKRAGKALTNFSSTLPPVRSDLAQQALKDPYVFDFLTLGPEAQERDLDLLFYHLKLRCFVVLELKTGEFKPEYAGKMNFYLSAVDAQLRRDGDAPSIGLVLCRERNKVIVEYALRDMKKPIGVSAFRLLERLPSSLVGSLPTVEQLEAELRAPTRRA